MLKIELLANKSGATKILSKNQLMKIYGGLEDETLEGCGTCNSVGEASVKRDCTKSTHPGGGCDCPLGATIVCVK